MGIRKYWSVSMLLTMLVTGCASTHTADYLSSEMTRKVGNEVLSGMPFDRTWDRLVERLSQDFFVINNIDKQSRLINISFSSNDPGQYIDCGRVARTFKTPSGKKEHYDYAVAGGATYKEGRGFDYNRMHDVIAHVTNRTNVEGRINIYIAPKGRTNTKVSVNTRYIFTVQKRGHIDYGSYSIPITGDLIKVAFNTNEPSDDATIPVCFSKGVIEEKILSMVKKTRRR